MGHGPSTSFLTMRVNVVHEIFKVLLILDVYKLKSLLEKKRECAMIRFYRQITTARGLQ